MLNSLKNYIIDKDKNLLDAVKLIDKNKKGFLIVLNGEKLYGTITDGDIRRALLKGIKLDEKVSDNCSINCKKLEYNNSLSSTIELFKNEAIKFIPIVDENNCLVNIITKKILHVLLLENINADLNYDFMSIDDNAMDYEIFLRPWGFYKTTAMNAYCQSKIIFVYPKSKLSLQSHERREEHWVIIHGEANVLVGDEEKISETGSYYHIPKQTKHRLENISDKEMLIVNEVQIGDYFGEDDIKRYEDDYGRI